ncbi:hypothetical protein HDU83_006908 [Entophlyctis luteolus]|nr:hypothetical protein HDU83_006908 [Entophlyctis luteolus]KAJ3379071.1 hypothetical protein HDU84_007065 [Entophlyctis sp. JEL0112]
MRLQLQTLGIRKEDISAPLPSQEVLLIKAEPIGQVGSTANTPSPDRPSMSRSHGHPRALSRSASASGLKDDPRSIMSGSEIFGPKVSFKSYQAFVMALSAYRKQIAAMAMASETFVRACEELEGSIQNAGDIEDASKIRDLDSLIDMGHLISNANQILAENIAQDAEQPLVKHLMDIQGTVKTRNDQNNARINDLARLMHEEEEESYKLGKKKQRDLGELQESLNLRMNFADEIKRLSHQNATIADRLASNALDLILGASSTTICTQMEQYEVIIDGLKKIDLFESGDYRQNKEPSKESVQKFLAPVPSVQRPPTPPADSADPNRHSEVYSVDAQGSSQNTKARAASSVVPPPPMRTTSVKPVGYQKPNNPRDSSTELTVDYVDDDDGIDPNDSISNVAPQESVLGPDTKRVASPTPRGVPLPTGPKVISRMKFFGVK